MSLKMSTMPPLGIAAIPFELPNAEGKVCRLEELMGPHGTLITFLCQHCPFVNLIVDKLSEIAAIYKDRGITTVAINSNDAAQHSEDSFENMRAYAQKHGFSFEYLRDESQSIARGYQAACTPDFFLYDRELRLAYRGQFDDSRPKNNVPVSGRDLIEAMEQVLAGGTVLYQKQSIGCNIKWKTGNEPEYYLTGSVR